MKIFRTVVLAFLVLVSSTSFKIGMHICMGEAENIALFGKAEGCQKEKSLPPCHKHMKPACCKDEIIFHEANDFKASAVSIQIVAPTSLDLERPLVLMSNIIPAPEISRTQYHNYDPPLRSSDLTVSLQVFLI